MRHCLHLVGQWVVVAGALVLATAGFFAQRRWMATDHKITQIMSMNPAEIVVRENMQQEQNEIASRSADAQERISGMSVYNAFAPQSGK